jgi:hypothetical protein
MSIDRAAQLKTLQLHGMATAWRELLAEAPRQSSSPGGLAGSPDRGRTSRSASAHMRGSPRGKFGRSGPLPTSNPIV